MNEVENELHESQGDDIAGLRAMFTDIKEGNKNSKKSGTKLMGDELLAKMFTPRKETEQFRFLQPHKGRKHIEETYFHTPPNGTNLAGGKRKYSPIYCIAKNDPKVPKMDNQGNPVLDSDGNPFMVTRKCPMCEKYENEKATQDNSIRKIKPENYTPEQKAIDENNKEIFKKAVKWEAKLFYIARGIDRGNTGDGVKFWRFKKNFRKTGVMDKLGFPLSLYIDQNNADYANPTEGTDIFINVSDDTMPNGKPYKVVSSIATLGKSPLSNDENVANQWINDPLTWRDIYREKKAPNLTSEEYLDRIVRGVDPYWDDTDADNKRWVFPDPADAELQKKANTREESLGSNDAPVAQQASDLVNNSYSVTMENMTPEDVGTFEDDAVDMSTPVAQEESVAPPASTAPLNPHDELPF
jgi:hypothetical protein